VVEYVQEYVQREETEMFKTNVTEARQKLFKFIKQVNQKHMPLHILYKNMGAVLMSEEDYESLIETLELLSTRGFKKSIQKSKQQIKKGKTYSMDEIFNDDK